MLLTRMISSISIFALISTDFLLKEGEPGTVVKLLPCDHEVMGSSLVEMQGKTAYIRPKLVSPFPGPCASGSYVHRAALFSSGGLSLVIVELSRFCLHFIIYQENIDDKTEF